MNHITRPDRPTIVCVDDEAEILAALRRLLRHEPYTVLTYTVASEALARIERGGVALVMADERMPALSGLDLLSRVAALSPSTIRLMLTGYPRAAINSAKDGRAIHRLLTKPWDDAELKRTIQELLEHGPRGDVALPLPAAEPAHDPRVTASLPAPRTGLDVGREQSSTAYLHRLVLVCVDDEPAVLGTLRRTLRREPYVVLTTESAAEALRWVREMFVNLLIAGDRMVDAAGVPLLGRVRQISSRTLRVLLTASPEHSPVAARMREEFHRLLVKPWNDEDFRQNLRELLELRGLRSEDYEAPGVLRAPIEERLDDPARRTP